jgi:hypothetical protein
MGHSTITITSDTYGHLYPAEDDRTRQAIDAAFATCQNPHDAATASTTKR